MNNFKDPNEFAFGKQFKTAKPLTKDQLEKMVGKPFYGKYQEGDIIIYFMEQKNLGTKNGIENLELKIQPITKRTLDRLNKEYKFIRMMGDDKYPVFEKKG
jgi:hypothetical protein